MKQSISIILILFLNISIFANDNQKTIEDYIGEYIDWEYIDKIEIYHIYGTARSNNKDLIYISIFFNTGTIEIKNNLNTIIENILFELRTDFQDYDFNIGKYYPFNMILRNNIDLNIDERQNIIDEIHNRSRGIIIKYFLNNIIEGYYEEDYYDFNEILAVIKKHFGIGNILNFN
jgi:hypothetical protein